MSLRMYFTHNKIIFDSFEYENAFEKCTTVVIITLYLTGMILSDPKVTENLYCNLALCIGKVA